MVAVSRDRLASALTPVVGAAGFDLEDVSVTQAGRRSVVRVVVDRDGGVDLDAVAEVARVVSAALDRCEAVGDAAYTLEVSSPGVDRPLTQPRHWRRATGRLVATAVARGRVLTADDSGVTLDVAGEPRRFGYDEIGAGRVQVEFDRPAGPGGAGSGGAGSGGAA